MYIVGLDLGQAQDYTAVAVVQRVPRPATQHDPEPRRIAWSTSSGAVGYAQPKRKHAYHVGHLERYPLGTRYPAIVTHVRDLLRTGPLLAGDTKLVLDHTGVGRAVGDLFDGASARPVKVTITGGDEVIRDNDYPVKVPKRDLISTLDVLFHSERLKIAEGLEEAPILVNELLNFRRKVNLKTAHDSYEAWRESVHDDLVLAVALACWYGENPPTLGRVNGYGGYGE